MEEITVDAVVENVEKVILFVNEHLEEMGCSMKAQVQIDVALDELFSNVANYAYTDGEGSVTVRVEEIKEEHSVKITFVDEGIPYNPLHKEDPDVTLSAEERSIGGLGIFLVKKTMDDTQYEYVDGKNVFSFWKKL